MSKEFIEAQQAMEESKVLLEKLGYLLRYYGDIDETDVHHLGGLRNDLKFWCEEIKQVIELNYEVRQSIQEYRIGRIRMLDC